MDKFSDVVSECGGHQLLECGWDITVSHLYYLALKSAEYHGEHGFAHILWFYAHLLISLCYFQLGPELSTCYVMSNGIFLRERCYIFPHVVILLSQIKHGV